MFCPRAAEDAARIQGEREFHVNNTKALRGQRCYVLSKSFGIKPSIKGRMKIACRMDVNSLHSNIRRSDYPVRRPYLARRPDDRPYQHHFTIFVYPVEATRDAVLLVPYACNCIQMSTRGG